MLERENHYAMCMHYENFLCFRILDEHSAPFPYVRKYLLPNTKIIKSYNISNLFMNYISFRLNVML